MTKKIILFCIVILMPLVVSASPITLEEAVETVEEQQFQNTTIGNTDPARFANVAVLQVLNKITGKTFKLNVNIGESIDFEKIKIEPLKCWKSNPDEKPENKLLIKIYDISQTKEETLFYGWFFSSTPGLSGLEHPSYDVVLLDCQKVQNDTTVDEK